METHVPIRQRRQRVALEGCQHSPLEGARPIHAPDPLKRMEVTVVLRPKNGIPDLHTASGSLLPWARKHLTREEFTHYHGANVSDIECIRAFAKEHHLEIAEEAPHRRTVVLVGPAERIARAFDVEFEHFHHERASYFATSKAPSIPLELEGIVEAVLGLHSRPSARRNQLLLTGEKKAPRSIRDLAAAYAFPEGTDGTGQTIGLIELGGGFNLADIEDYCSGLAIAVPRITSIEVQGGANRPAKSKDVRELLECVQGELQLSAQAMESAAMGAAQSTVEVTMDIEIVAALAPGAHIVVYFATADEQGIYNAIARAIHDPHHSPDVLSISWGEPEVGLSDAYIRAVDRALLAASHLGISVCASSGDAGAINDSPDKLPAVNFPASSPHCLACGGTTTRFSGSQITDEIVWNSSHYGMKGATGGGVSRKFAVPAWQKRAKVPPGPTGKHGRGVPDVAGPADPRYGCEILVAGHSCVTAGTSAVAPLWAALIARCNQAINARCGHLHDLIYHLGHESLPALRPVTQGHNDVYQATEGWNPCAGHGTPHGENLLRYLKHGIPPRGGG